MLLSVVLQKFKNFLKCSHLCQSFLLVFVLFVSCLRNPSLLWYHQYFTLYIFWTVLTFVFHTFKPSESYFLVCCNVEIYFFPVWIPINPINFTNSTSFPIDLDHFCDVLSSHFVKGLNPRISVLYRWFIYCPGARSFRIKLWCTVRQALWFSPTSNLFWLFLAIHSPIRILRTACKVP